MTRHVSGLQDVLHLFYVFLIIFTEINVPVHKKSKLLVVRGIQEILVPFYTSPVPKILYL